MLVLACRVRRPEEAARHQAPCGSTQVPSSATVPAPAPPACGPANHAPITVSVTVLELLFLALPPGVEPSPPTGCGAAAAAGAAMWEGCDERARRLGYEVTAGMQAGRERAWEPRD